MEKFIIPVTKVEMSSEDFNKTREAMIKYEEHIASAYVQIKKMENFIKKIDSLVSHNVTLYDIIEGDADYDISLSYGVSEKPYMSFQIKK